MYILLLAVLIASCIAWRWWWLRRNKYPRWHEIDLSILKNGASAKKLEAAGVADYIVVGSGLAGLTTASLLARAGYKVVVLEQHDVAGGATHVFEEKGFAFDVGVHYVGEKLGDKWSGARRLFDVVTDGQLEWSKFDDVYDVALNMATGQEMRFGDDHQDNLEKIVNKFGESVRPALQRYKQACDLARLAMLGLWSLKLMPLWLARFVAPIFAPAHEWAWGRTASHVMGKCGLSTDVIGVLTAFFGDYGLPPGKAPFGMQAVLDSHYEGGAYFPRGGSSSVAKTIVAALNRRGSHVFVRAPVTEICVQGGRATGVVCKGVRLTAKKGVISDAGAVNTFVNLLPPKAAKPALDALKDKWAPSLGMCYVFVGMDAAAADLDLPAANTWMFPDWRHDHNFEAFKNKDDPLPAVFLASGSAKDDAHTGATATIQLIAPVQRDWFDQWRDTKLQHRGAAYETFKDEWQRRLLEDYLYVRFPKTKGHVKHVQVATPLTTAWYLNADQGATYGLDHSIPRFELDAQLALHTQTCVDRLFLVGQDHLFVGVLSAFASGVIAASHISKQAAALAVVDAILGHH